MKFELDYEQLQRWTARRGYSQSEVIRLLNRFLEVYAPNERACTYSIWQSMYLGKKLKACRLEALLAILDLDYTDIYAPVYDREQLKKAKKMWKEYSETLEKTEQLAKSLRKYELRKKLYKRKV